MLSKCRDFFVNVHLSLLQRWCQFIRNFSWAPVLKTELVVMSIDVAFKRTMFCRYYTGVKLGCYSITSSRTSLFITESCPDFELSSRLVLFALKCIKQFCAVCLLIAVRPLISFISVGVALELNRSFSKKKKRRITISMPLTFVQLKIRICLKTFKFIFVY